MSAGPMQQASAEPYCDASCDRLSQEVFSQGEYLPSAPTQDLATLDAPAYPSTPTSSGTTGGGFSGLNLISGSTPGETFAAFAPGTYIDNAIIANVFRFRFDAAYNNPLPDRAEFLYPAYNLSGMQGQVDPEVDYQEFRPYFERAISRRFSVFLETPIRLLNPDINANTGGFSDLQTGFKSSLYDDGCEFLTAQLRVYAPTGDADRGLGTGHTSLEPGLLYLGRVTDRFVTQGEFAVWVPIGGTEVTGLGDFAGPVLRYGIGGGYDLLNLDTRRERRRLTSTLETVGWTVTDGLATDPNLGIIDASGDTIVNIKSGLRYTAGRRSIAAGYGVAVTGDRWYSDILRVELRTVF